MKRISQLALLACAFATGVHAQNATPTESVTAKTKPAPKEAATEVGSGGTRTARKTNYFTSKTPAPGGDREHVWANSHTKRYHCFGTRYYGRTYQGSYTDEASAVESGMRPANHKGCAK